MVTFTNGKSGLEVYRKRNSAPLSAAELASLLVANGGGTKWHQPVCQGYDSLFNEKSRFAYYYGLTHELWIGEPNALNYLNQVNQVLDIKNMKGF